MTELQPEPLLALTGVDKRYGGVQALRDVAFDVQAGEVHALLGENGAGKSTLIKIIAGAVSRDAGTIKWRGEEIEITSPADAMRFGIQVIFQQLNVVPDLTVAENLTLGRERSTLGFIDRDNTRRSAQAALERLGVTLRLNRTARGLRVAEKQLIEIARAISSDVSVLLMDEPTASLGEQEVEHLFEVIRDLRNRGIGIIYISHRLEEVLGIADRITVLRDGQKIGTVPAKDTTREALITMMVGRELGHAWRKKSHVRDHVELQVDELSTETGLKDVSLTLHAGEVLGVYGLLGSGRTELARALFGADPILSGTIRVGQHTVRMRSPKDAKRQGIGLVPEDRSTQGIFARLSVRENLTSASGDRISRLGWLQRASERRLSRQVVESLRIRTPSIEQPVGRLSGGNQQKVTLGRWLMRDAPILILDDPTAGVDVGAKDDLYRLISETTAAGTAVILFTSELPELLGLADRALVLHQGRVAGVLDRDELTQEQIGRLALGEAGLTKSA